MDYIGVIQSIWTVVAMTIFVAIGLWAWSGRRKDEFDEAANLPLGLPVKQAGSKEAEKKEDDNV